MENPLIARGAATLSRAAPVVIAYLATFLAASHANADNLIKNGDFENGCIPSSATCSEWTLIPTNSAVDTDAHTPKYSVAIGGEGGGTGGVTQLVELINGHIYGFSFWYKGSRGIGLTPLIARVGTRTVFATMVNPATNWTLYQVPVQADKDGPTEVHIFTENGPHYVGPLILIDDVQLTE
ncbi:carbohydrate binding domain-containing protein [Rhizobium ruizarguesonis]